MDSKIRQPDAISKFLNKLFKKGGFILEDASGNEHVIGEKINLRKLN